MLSSEEIAQRYAVIGQLSAVVGVRLVGLMTIGPFVADPEDSRPIFHRLRQLRDELRRECQGLCHLSMGMTADYEVAVEEGATMVRIGTALFGH